MVLFNWLLNTVRALLVVNFLLLGMQAQAAYVSVTGIATDLPDVVVGQDRWQMDYRLEGALPAYFAVTLVFPTSSFDNLQLVSSPSAIDWDTALTPGNGGAGFDGLLTFTAQRDFFASDVSVWRLNFTLLGNQALQPQTYEIADDSFNVVDGGLAVISRATTPPPNTVPEPASWTLMGLGLVQLVRARVRYRARPRPS